MRVFISHSHSDKPFVRMLAEDIKASKVAIWLDEVELLLGDSLIIKISEAIRDADYLVACLSKNSVQSNWVRKELAIAMTLGINGNRISVLPLLLQGLPTSDIPPFLADQVYADFGQPGSYDSAFHQLLRRVNPAALPKPEGSFYGLTLGATRKDRLIEVAQSPEMRNWVIDYLIETLAKREDPTERYWAYIALGQLGGEKAEAAIKTGLLDLNKFARTGAESVWRSIK